jgi:hypothetical protein
MKRVPDALALYRREIDRNADDPGLYDVLAAFLEQNRSVPRQNRFISRRFRTFQEHSWSQKLARWYLRQRRAADMARLTRDVVKIFSGTELESVLPRRRRSGSARRPGAVSPTEFGCEPAFSASPEFRAQPAHGVHDAATRNDVAYDALLRQHWYHADDLRQRFFDRLSRTGRLENELAVLRSSNPAAQAARWPEAEDQNPALVRMLAEGEAWRSHFEVATPIFSAISADFPADAPLGPSHGDATSIA